MNDDEVQLPDVAGTYSGMLDIRQTVTVDRSSVIASFEFDLAVEVAQDGAAVTLTAERASLGTAPAGPAGEAGPAGGRGGADDDEPEPEPEPTTITVAGTIDAAGNWTADDGHLVQVGGLTGPGCTDEQRRITVVFAVARETLTLTGRITASCGTITYDATLTR
ncbi:MAG: hypothetical protein OXC31_29410 [Spirochaetaceae bacterium]|nr:hypothetical protein [Spirochaetaceae bacterium]